MHFPGAPGGEGGGHDEVVVVASRGRGIHHAAGGPDFAIERGEFLEQRIGKGTGSDAEFLAAEEIFEARHQVLPGDAVEAIDEADFMAAGDDDGDERGLHLRGLVEHFDTGFAKATGVGNERSLAMDAGMDGEALGAVDDGGERGAEWRRYSEQSKSGARVTGSIR